MGYKIWNIANVYAPNARNGRYSLREELSVFLSQNKNTFCVGDFNLPLYPLEKIGGMIDLNDSMIDFSDFIDSRLIERHEI